MLGGVWPCLPPSTLHSAYDNNQDGFALNLVRCHECALCLKRQARLCVGIRMIYISNKHHAGVERRTAVLTSLHATIPYHVIVFQKKKKKSCQTLFVHIIGYLMCRDTPLEWNSQRNFPHCHSVAVKKNNHIWHRRILWKTTTSWAVRALLLGCCPWSLLSSLFFSTSCFLPPQIE